MDGDQEMRDEEFARVLARQEDSEIQSISSSDSASSSADDLYPLFRPRKKPALAAERPSDLDGASSSVSISSSSSASSSSDEIEWVDRSQDKKWTADVWKLGVFLCSKEKIGGANSKYKVRCKFCHWCTDYDGTTDMAYHAEHKHPTVPTVAAWLKEKQESLVAKKAHNLNQHESFVQVCVGLFFALH